jgi:hypothetical protein
MPRVKPTAADERPEATLTAYFFPDLGTTLLATTPEEAQEKAARLRADRS